MKSAAIFLTMLLLTAPASAQMSRDRSIEIESAWARIAPNEAGTLSLFFEVVSTRKTPDILMAATSSAAGKIRFRRGKWEGLDFYNKSTGGGVPIKANKRTSFHPGVLEVTLSELNVPTIVGETVPVTLVFKDAGEIVITPTISNQLLGNRGRK